MKAIAHQAAPLIVPETAERYQAISRAIGEAARLKAAHRYFQRTTPHVPFNPASIPLD